MSAYQQSLLNGIDCALEARDPRLAQMFAVFTRLTGEDGPPRTERLVPGPNALAVALRGSVRWARATSAIPVMLVVGLLAAIVALGVATSGGPVCPTSAVLHHVGQTRTGACPTSANGLNQ